MEMSDSLMGKDVLAAIKALSPTFSKGQRRIAAFITENYEKAAFMTAGKLGQSAGVSESTVVRFASDIGYEGYPEMRRAMQELVKNRLTTVQRIEVARDMITGSDVPEVVLNSDISKIRHTLDELDRAEFDRAARTISRARTIYIVGVRSSAVLSGFMGFYLNQLFPDVRVISQSAFSEIYEQILHIGPEDVLVAISFPRYSRRTIMAMRYARDKGAKIVGITDSESSLVAQLADIKLYARSDMVSFLDSLVAPLSLINALVVAVAERSGEDLGQAFERLENIWTEFDVYEKYEQ